MFPPGARGLAFLCVAALLPRVLLAIALGVAAHRRRGTGLRALRRSLDLAQPRDARRSDPHIHRRGEFLARELPLALIGVFVALRAPGRDAAILAISVMVAVSLLQCAFYVQGRHRFLIEPILLIFTAMGVAQLTRSTKSPSA